MILHLLKLEINLPKIISEFPLIHQLKSSSFPNKFYKVNLSNYSCSCKDWVEKRSSFDNQDIRRICKHIAYFMRIIPYYWILPVPSCDYRLSTINIEGYNYCLIQKDNYWVDVIVVNRKSDVYCYGYNFSEKRWAYKTFPRHSKFIRPLILLWVKNNSPHLWKIECKTKSDLSTKIENLKLEDDNLLEIEMG